MLQWNPSITDNLGTQNSVRYNDVSLSQGLPVGVVCVTGLLGTTWLRFQSFPLVYPEASTTTNSNESNVKLLTTAAMVDNLAKKVDECPLNRDR